MLAVGTRSTFITARALAHCTRVNRGIGTPLNETVGGAICFQLFAADAVDGQAAEADAQLVVEQRLRVGKVSQPGVGVGHVREPDPEVVADVVRG
jgi:hypothetical protein